MHCLVTGGAGFIGSHLVDRLLELGHTVTVVDNFVSGDWKNLAQHASDSRLHIVDTNITSDLNALFEKEKPEIIFHLAALPRVQYSIDFPVETHKTNVDGTANMLEMARVHGIKRFISTSSSSVYGDQDTLPLVETMIPNPMSPYALHKLVGEQYCSVYHEVYGLETISLRHFNVYGPRQNPNGGYANLIPKVVVKVLNNEAPAYTNDGKQTRDFTYISDVVDSYIKAMTTSNSDCFGQSFNTGGGKNISVLDVLDTVIKLSGKDLKPVFLENRFEPHDTKASTKKAKRLLDWEPKVDFSQGIKEMWNYYCNLGK